MHTGTLAERNVLKSSSEKQTEKGNFGMFEIIEKAKNEKKFWSDT